MTTYVYETIPQKKGAKPEYFGIKQGMKDAPLTKHPKSGKLIRRTVLGGHGVLKSGGSAKKPKSSGDNCCCGPSGCCD
jgi:predicted nucleic acid-binding Zn ribbon protein